MSELLLENATTGLHIDTSAFLCTNNALSQWIILRFFAKRVRIKLTTTFFSVYCKKLLFTLEICNKPHEEQIGRRFIASSFARVLEAPLGSSHRSPSSHLLAVVINQNTPGAPRSTHIQVSKTHLPVLTLAELLYFWGSGGEEERDFTKRSN